MKYKSFFLLPILLSSSIAFSGGAEKPPANFTGFYIGFGTGLSTVLTKDSFTTVRASGLGGDQDTNRYTYTSILYAAQLGYGMQFNNNFYLAAEGLITYAPLNTTDETGFSTAAGSVLIIGNNTIHTTSKPTYAINLVLGYALTPSFLPFIEGGVSFGKLLRNYTIKRTRTNVATQANVGYQTTLSVGKYNTEFDVGIGARQLMGEHCLVSGSLMYTYLGKNTSSSSVAIPSASDTETHTRTNKSFALSWLSTVSFLF